MQIEGIELLMKHCGKEVIYSQPGRKGQQTIGKIHSWNEQYVLVRFPISENPHKCSPEKLKWKRA